jgi:hypothetical protein
MCRNATLQARDVEFAILCIRGLKDAIGGDYQQVTRCYVDSDAEKVAPGIRPRGNCSTVSSRKVSVALA